MIATRLIFHITAALPLVATGLLTLGPSTARELDADEGKTVKVKVSFTGDDDDDESLTSVATATVSAAPSKHGHRSAEHHRYCTSRGDAYGGHFGHR